MAALLVILCALFVDLFSILTHGANIPATEMNALKDLYESTNGTHWKWDPLTSEIGTVTNTNGVPWNFTSTANPCTERWQGINCSFTVPFTYYHISKLVLVLHNLEGTLPATIGNFSRLNYMNLEQNGISGTLPHTLAKLSGLLVLNLGLNHFRGTVPQSLQGLSHLQELFLGDNELSGQLLEAFVSMSNLRTMYLNNNELSGMIPSSISLHPELTFLHLDGNQFTGTVPEALCQLTVLTELKIQNNDLHGPIPPCLGSLSTLDLLELSNNSLTGSIPDSLGSLSSLTILYLQKNELTGSIPYTVGGMVSMLDFNVNQNRLTGSLPAGMSAFTKMTNAYVHNNYLTGSLEPMLGWKSSIFLYMQDNIFTGTIPSLTNLTLLTSFFLSNNKLSGSLERVFDPPRNVYVTTIQLSNNQLTGTLSEDIFDLRRLTTFAAGGNCFIGSLPITICDSQSLRTLILDGLYSATSCRNNIFSGVTNRYISEANIKGGIPSCLFRMFQLTTLHLSGNGLTGPISTERISFELRDLSVSHNALTGTIPQLFQTKLWYNLDLSYNKFRGTLEMNYEPFTSNNTVQFYNITLSMESVALSLRNNRLSGKVPDQLAMLRNISVLDGNLFACSIDQSDLPSHDQGRSTYQCGSNSFNVSYYIWVCTAGFLVLLALLMVYFHHYIGNLFRSDQFMYYYDMWMHHLEFGHERDSVLGKDITLKNFKYLIYVCEGMCKVSIYCTAYILIVLIPIYVAGSQYYSTHSFTYAWSVSAAFLSGPTALTMLMVAFVVFLTLVFVLFTVNIHQCHQQYEALFCTGKRNWEGDENAKIMISTQRETSVTPLLMNANVFLYVIFFAINFIVVLGVNVVYVYVRLYQPSSLFFIAQLLLSVFKIVWNSFCSVYIIRWVSGYLTRSGSENQKQTESGLFAIQLFVALFNYIAIPCLVVGAISPDCYNNVLIDNPSVNSHFFYEQCEIFNPVLGCSLSIPQMDQTTYSPPFTYSYQCSSSIVTYYAPSFVYLSFIVTFINPLLAFVCGNLYARRVRGSFIGEQLDRLVPRILRTLELREEPTHSKQFLNPDRLLLTLATYLGVLLTFGVVFPPLAACMLLSILAVMFSTKLVVGRFLTNAIDAGLAKYVNIIESECEGAGSIPKLRMSMRLLLLLCICFYTPFLFDTLGDSVGLDGSYWVIFFLPLLGVVGIGINCAWNYTRRRVLEEQRCRSNSLNMIELSDARNNVDSMIASPLDLPLRSIDGSKTSYMADANFSPLETESTLCSGYSVSNSNTFNVLHLAAEPEA